MNLKTYLIDAMKISIGTNIKEGPWGGGNLFAKSLKKFLIDKNYEVCTDLKSDDIDLILITEPRKTSESSAYTHIDVAKYLEYVKKDTLVLHRVNECDERKNTKFVNKYLINANKVADYTIFVSNWLKNLYMSQGLDREYLDVIYAGSDAQLFNSNNSSKWDKNLPLKIVTHHWGANWNKGFDIYLYLDELISTDRWKNKISFTYIGNLPKDIKFKNSSVIKPLSGNELVDKIKENHVYLTASLNEPSGNHHIEGAQCGLPLIFINSGGTPEYCNGYGVMFNNKKDFEKKLNEVFKNFDLYKKIINDYPFNSEKMCIEYLKVFDFMIENKEKFIKKRIYKHPTSFIGKKYFNFKRSR